MYENLLKNIEKWKSETASVTKAEPAYKLSELTPLSTDTGERGAIGEFASGVGRGMIRTAATPAYLADFA